MSNQRQSYHSDFKLAVQLDCVPSNILSRIPRSSRHRFKYSDYSTLYGSELSSLFENMDLIKEIAQSKAALHTARAVLRIASFVRLCPQAVVVLAEIKDSRVSRHSRTRILSLVTRAKALSLVSP